jgi:hypothetical protein
MFNKGTGDMSEPVDRGVTEEHTEGEPQPSMQFRRRAWLQFQRALDPLARPKPLPMKRRR